MASPKPGFKEINRVTWNLGYFAGIDQLARQYNWSAVEKATVKRHAFEHILDKVAEAKDEIRRLEKAIERIEAACRFGAGASLSEGTAGSASVNNLKAALQPFDGWVVSILETDFSLLHVVHNPETAYNRINGLRESFANLWRDRQQDQYAFANRPEYFDV